MSRNTTIGIVAVIAVLLLGWFYLRSSKSVYAPPQATPSSASASTAPEKIVTISSGGFSPEEIIIKAGETVAWVNSDTDDHTVNSAEHPTHLVYPSLNLEVIKPGEQKPLSFPTAGTYQYHDHLNPSLVGSVTVQ